MSDYFLAMVGGLLISVASSINLLLKGRITGISGICWSLVSFDRDSVNWKLPFLLSFLFVGAAARFFMSYPNQVQFFMPADELVFGLSRFGFLIGGFCVGLGTKLANGCTSGHGVCGLPRFSLRSWIAVPTFLFTAVLVANIRAHLPFFEDNNNLANIYILPTLFDSPKAFWVILLGSGIGLVVFTVLKLQKHNVKAVENIVIGSLVGGIFAAGLIVSGMVDRANILGFLTLGKGWNPALMLVLLVAVGLNALFFNSILAMGSPLRAKTWEFNQSAKLDRKLVVGSIIFGVGWGITGLCPGPALLLLQFGTIKVTLFYFFGLIAGQSVGFYCDKGLFEYVLKIVHKYYNKLEPVRGKVTTGEPIEHRQSARPISNVQAFKADARKESIPQK